MMNIGVIGCGHWGPNYVRNFVSSDEVTEIFCCDSDKAKLDRMKHQFHNVKLTQDYNEVLSNPDVNAVIIATPTMTHFELASKALSAGKHTLVEKPLTLEHSQCLKLKDIAKKNDAVLMVAHTFLYNPAVVKMKEYIKEGRLGKIYYMHSTRTHLGLIREDVNAVWDLAPHDISIFSFLLGSNPVSVSAMGGMYLKDGRHDVAFVNLAYEDNIIANIHISWADSNKVRQVEVVGSQARLMFDDLNNLEKIKLFEKGISTDQQYDNFGEFQYILRDGDIISPKIELKEPLKLLCQHFIDCVGSNKQPLTDADNGADVVKVLNAIEESLKNNGKVVKL